MRLDGLWLLYLLLGRVSGTLDSLEKIRNFIILKYYYYENEGDEEIKIIDNYKIQYNSELLQNELNNKELLI